MFRFITLILLFNICCIPSFATTAEERAGQIEKASVSRFNSHNIRFKIIESRALVLYLSDILPEKGNPYFHASEFGQVSTKAAFNRAMEENASFMKTRGLFLPPEGGQAIIDYFLQYVATVEVLQEAIYPTLKASILVGSIENTSDKQTHEKFNNAWELVSHIKNEYKKLLPAEPYAKAVRQITLSVAASLANSMQDHIDHVKDGRNDGHLDQFLESVKKITDLSAEKSKLEITKQVVAKIFDERSKEFKSVAAALNGVDLPESGDIDGSEEAFDVVMRLDVGFDILLAVREKIKTW